MLQNISSRLQRILDVFNPGSRPRMGEPLKVGQKNDLFEVVGVTEIRIKGNVSVTQAQDDDGNAVALMLNNGRDGALICLCPNGYEGVCSPSTFGDMAVCQGTCSHVEINRTISCIFGWVSGASFPTVLAPL